VEFLYICGRYSIEKHQITRFTDLNVWYSVNGVECKVSRKRPWIGSGWDSCPVYFDSPEWEGRFQEQIQNRTNQKIVERVVDKINKTPRTKQMIDILLELDDMLSGLNLMNENQSI